MGIDVSLILAIISLILGLINSYLLYKNWVLISKKEDRNRPIIKIKKERNPGGTLLKKRGLCGLQVRIRNIGLLPASLVKVKVLIKRKKNRSFSPSTEKYPSLPLDISSLKEKKLNIYFKLSKEMGGEIEKNLPIKANIRFEFTHVEINGDFLIGKKGIFLEKEELKVKGKRHHVRRPRRTPI